MKKGDAESEVSGQFWRSILLDAEAMIEVYGAVPEYGGRGRSPTRKQPEAEWQYVQMVKERDAQGRVTGVELWVVFGSPAEVLTLLGKSAAYIERNHLTSRLFNGRQRRKTLAFSKEMAMNRVAAIWEDSYYNLVRSTQEPALTDLGQGRTALAAPNTGDGGGLDRS